MMSEGNLVYCREDSPTDGNLTADGGEINNRMKTKISQNQITNITTDKIGRLQFFVMWTLAGVVQR
jgi:hypothetical protein